MEKNHPERYGQRVTDVAVVETGLSLGVKTYIVVPPTIYGKGSGPFATLSQQVPNLARLARKRGYAAVIESGAGIWNHVHILDLANFYLLLFRAVREQPNWLPSGPRAIFFVESGEHTWLQVSQGIADALHKQGLLDNNKVESISMKEAAAEITRGNESLVEITLASNSRARADFARNRLGWKTSRGNEDFLNHFDGEIEAMREELQASTQ
jgi:nucleoside-diphosphate-sugar epimerase